jgi:hypothetical protein
MQMCLDDHDLSESLVAKGYERIMQFSWQASADLIWKTLNEI